MERLIRHFLDESGDSSSGGPIRSTPGYVLLGVLYGMGDVIHPLEEIKEQPMVALQEEELLIEETEQTDDDEPQNIRYEITSFPTDFTVKMMYEKWQSGQLIIPEYQRRYVWNLPQASRLIESFLLGLPIPQVFLYRERSSPELIVVDGHQRLGTIAYFYSGRFPDDREFRLRGVNSTWEGKNYTNLNEDDRLTLDDSTLRSIVIRQIQPNDNSSVYEIFERLNTGGTQLNAMEIRRAIFRGRANDFLDRLNENPDWRTLIGMPQQAPRFRDIELLLRVLALAENWSGYVKPMKKFINDYMEVLDGADAEQIRRLEQRFAKACEVLRSELGEKPFHLRQRLNMAAMDAVMACSVELADSLKAGIGAEYKRLRDNNTFIEAVTYNTSDASAVQQRFQLVHSALAS